MRKEYPAKAPIFLFLCLYRTKMPIKTGFKFAKKSNPEYITCIAKFKP